MKVREVVDAVEQDNCSLCSSSTCGSCKIDAGDNGFNSALSTEISEAKLRKAGWVKMPVEEELETYILKFMQDALSPEYVKPLAKSIITYLGGK
jgi:hypothetical protein